MSEGKKRRKIALITSFIVGALVAVTAIALIITNVFIPVKYISAYCVKKSPPAENTVRVTFVDVGYGDCTVVEFPDGKTALIDAGDGGHAHTQKILKTLNTMGVDRLDYLVCTSVSDKRCGGLYEIVKYKSPQKIFAPYCPVTYINDGYRKFSNAVKDADVTFVEYGEGIIDDLHGYRMCFLSPTEHTATGSEYLNFINSPTENNIDNCSGVVWLEYGGNAVLLLGNVDSAVQDKLVKLFDMGIEVAGKRLDYKKCEIVKIPCNGSAKSVNSEIIEKLNPNYAVLSVGENGRGYPNVQAIANAQKKVGENLLRTDVNGNITVCMNNDGNYTVKSEKL